MLWRTESYKATVLDLFHSQNISRQNTCSDLTTISVEEEERIDKRATNGMSSSCYSKATSCYLKGFIYEQFGYQQ